MKGSLNGMMALIVIQVVMVNKTKGQSTGEAELFYSGCYVDAKI